MAQAFHTQLCPNPVRIALRGSSAHAPCCAPRHGGHELTNTTRNAMHMLLLAAQRHQKSGPTGRRWRLTHGSTTAAFRGIWCACSSSLAHDWPWPDRLAKPVCRPSSAACFWPPHRDIASAASAFVTCGCRHVRQTMRAGCAEVCGGHDECRTEHHQRRTKQRDRCWGHGRHRPRS